MNTTQKIAVLLLSDPKSGSEEALGRLFNALATVYEFDQRGDEVTLVFHGTGTRWPAELDKEAHPAHELWKAVGHRVAGVSCGCADVFSSSEEIKKSGYDLLKDAPIPGTSGVASVAKLTADGYTVLTF